MAEPQLDEAMLHYQRIIQQGAKALGEAFYSIKVPVEPAYARSAAATHRRVRAIDEEFGLLTSSEMGRQMGSRSANPRNSALAARRDGRLLALKEGSQLLFPGFQLDDTSSPWPVIRELSALGTRLGWSERSILMWLVQPTTYLDGKRPVEVLDDELGTVVNVAEQSWSATW